MIPSSWSDTAAVACCFPPSRLLAALPSVDCSSSTSDVPDRTGETPLMPEPFMDQLTTLAVAGSLPPWSTWWGEDAMRNLVPDPDQRTELAAEMPSLPLAYFFDRVPSPPGWDRVPGGYLQLSDAYSDAAAEARCREWPVEVITGAQHLHIVVAPGVVADALLRLAH